MKHAVALLFLVLATSIAFGQWRRRGGGWRDVRTAREVASDNGPLPVWTNPPAFAHDVFTFARIRYEDNGRWGRGGWSTDIPDSDINLSFRLQQMTSMLVDPDGRVLRLTDPDLFDFPFIYIVEPGGLYLAPDEVAALRKYLLNGGFLMLDDFWGPREWDNCERVLKQVLPEYSFQELSLDHPLYRSVFTIKEKGQVPNMRQGAESEHTGVTWEGDEENREVRHRAILDERGRMMVFATHNSDNGDGWEQEGYSAYYFHNFSEKVAYPLGINVIFYVMTH